MEKQIRCRDEEAAWSELQQWNGQEATIAQEPSAKSDAFTIQNRNSTARIHGSEGERGKLEEKALQLWRQLTGWGDTITCQP
jgi:hypothetical protein